MPTTINPKGIRTLNTTIATDEATGDTIVRLYRTTIYRKHGNVVTLYTGGSTTPTTLRRMNECLYHFRTPRPDGRNVGIADFRTTDTLTWTV